MPSDTLEALKAVEAEILSVGEEAGDDSAKRATFAISTHLSEELDRAIESDEKASEIADAIVETFQERVDTTYSGWATNKQTEQDIELVIIDVLKLDYDRGDLIDDHLVDAIREYLINNYV